MSKPDFLRECMSDPALVKGQVPLDEFNRTYCVRCIQKECSRAGLNSSLLARRAETWKVNLFDSPPRAADDDPRYASIRAKKFTQLANEVVEVRQGGVNYEVQTRDLPSALVRAEPERSEEEAPPDTLPEPPAETPTPTPTPAPTVPGPELESRPQHATPPPHAAPLQNTPFEQGTVLPGGRQSAPSETVVEVGGSYVFGSDE